MHMPAQLAVHALVQLVERCADRLRAGRETQVGPVRDRPLLLVLWPKSLRFPFDGCTLRGDVLLLEVDIVGDHPICLQRYLVARRAQSFKSV